MRVCCVWAVAALWLAATSGQMLPCPRKCQCFFNTHALLQVDCSGLDLTSLPAGIDEQTQILDLSNNLLTSIPKEISSITYLEKLNLSGNKIKALSANSLVNLTSLVLLDLSRNEISQWEDINPNTMLLQATNLRRLVLSKNPIKLFANLKATEMLISSSLHALEMNNCGITSIHGKSPIGGLTDLRHLSMTHNPLKRFQRLISPTLQSLDFSYCELTYINPDELTYLSSLSHLIMAHNYRLSFNKADSLSSYSLKSIDLSFCNMNKVSLAGFPNLETVNLRGNMIRSLTSGEYVNNSLLTTLDLSSNALGSIHKNALDGLTSLRYLNLSVNVIPNIPDDTFVKTQNLSIINLSRNYLSSVGSLKSSSLISIDMSYCEIQTLEANAFESLPLLQDINLSRNLLSTVPDLLTSTSLEILDLSFNRLSSIRNETFALLPALTKLYLSENRFTETWKTYYFSGNRLLEEITLQDNTWRCDCSNPDMKYFFDYLTNDPPKVWNMNHLMCYSPSNLSNKNWLEACYFTWNPDGPLNQNQRALTYVLVLFILFFAVCFIIMLIKRSMRLRIKAAQDEQVRQAEEDRDRLRELRMSREQEQQRNAPDPRDLVSPPSYDEALLMPRLDGSYHSLSGVGVGQEKKQIKRGRRRTRSIGDIESDSESRSHRSRRRKRRQSKNDEIEPEPDQSLTTHQSEGNLVEVCVVHRMHESDL